jgi:cell division septal protein FtsQ
MKSKAKPTLAPPRNKRVSSRKQRKQQHLLDVKVRSRAATRQRNRRVLAWLSGVFLFCAAVGGIVYGGHEALRRFFWQNPDYNLAEVTIHTDGSLTREQIVAATNIHEGKNIFAVNLSAARKGLMALPQVDRAEIERILPNKISIDIAERKPVAWVTGKDDDNPSADPGAFLIDRNGVLIRVRSQVPEYYHLPVICGLDVDNYEEGGTVDLPEVRAALEMIRITGENPARYQVRSIDVSKGYCLVVTDERHAKVTFPLDNIAAELDRLALLYANIDSNQREIQTVNLLVQRNVPVTFVPPPDPTADAADPTAIASPSPAVAQPSPAMVKKALPLSTKKPTIKRAQALHKSTGADGHDHPVRRAIPVSSPSPRP